MARVVGRVQGRLEFGRRGLLGALGGERLARRGRERAQLTVALSARTTLASPDADLAHTYRRGLEGEDRLGVDEVDVDEVVALELELDRAGRLGEDEGAVERERDAAGALRSPENCQNAGARGDDAGGGRRTVKSSMRSASSPERTARYVRFLVSTARSILAPLVRASLTYSSGDELLAG